MSYYSDMKIINKKCVGMLILIFKGTKLLYLVVTSNSKRWIDY